VSVHTCGTDEVCFVPDCIRGSSGVSKDEMENEAIVLQNKLDQLKLRILRLG